MPRERYTFFWGGDSYGRGGHFFFSEKTKKNGSWLGVARASNLTIFRAVLLRNGTVSCTAPSNSSIAMVGPEGLSLWWDRKDYCLVGPEGLSLYWDPKDYRYGGTRRTIAAVGPEGLSLWWDPKDAPASAGLRMQLR